MADTYYVLSECYLSPLYHYVKGKTTNNADVFGRK